MYVFIHLYVHMGICVHTSVYKLIYIYTQINTYVYRYRLEMKSRYRQHQGNSHAVDATFKHFRSLIIKEATRSISPNQDLVIQFLFGFGMFFG